MSYRALILFAWLAAAAANAQQTYPLAGEELLRSARIWEARDRGDMARLALERLVAARPDSPDALLELGELHLRMGDIAAAQKVLDDLTRRFPTAQATKTFATELRVASRDRLELASVQRLLQVGRGRDARIALEKLFPDGAPAGMYGIEYYQLLASTPGGWERARDGLRSLADRRADDPRYRLALARHLMSRDATEVDGLRILDELARRDDVRLREVDASIASALVSLGYRRAPAAVARAYLARHPDDAAIARLLQQRVQIDDELQGFLERAQGATSPGVQRSNLQQIADAMLESDVEASFERTLALLQALRLGRTAGLPPHLSEAVTWTQRSIATARNDMARATLEKDAAVAFAARRFESTIELQQRFIAAGATAEAGELLSSATRLDPASSWLFETQIRELLARGEIDEAIRRLESRPIGNRWTTAARDELLAAALDRRAEGALAAGNTAQAKEDWRRAILLDTDNPWTRYRLASVLAREGNTAEARALMSPLGHAPEMRFATALLLSAIDDDRGALTTIDAVPAEARTEGMRDLHDRMRIAVARLDAQAYQRDGNPEAARAALAAVEPLAERNIDRGQELANAWFDLGERERALRMVDPARRSPPPSNEALLAWANALNRAEDPRLPSVIAELDQRSLTSEQSQGLVRLRRSASLREIRELQRKGDEAGAERLLQELLATNPDDRELRILLAEIELSSGRAAAARDRFAALVAEDPQDLAARLGFVRALTETGDVELARLQLQSAADQAPAEDVELQLGIARRLLDLGATEEAARTAEAVAARAPNRMDALVLAGRARLAQGQIEAARALFAQAQSGTDAQAASEARRAIASIDLRRRHWMEAGFEMRHKPGDPGVSEFEALLIPSLWTYGYDYRSRLTLRADAIRVDAGTLPGDYDTAALLGTVQAAGPNAARPYRNDAQEGLSLGAIYATDQLAVDLGTTPLGFLQTNLVGGIEWAPDWFGIDWTLGLERRAVTSSVLSYAGMRDPITGREWGGVVETGPYLQVGRYREFFSIAGALRHTRLEGENVPNNRFTSARVNADWKFVARPEFQAFVGAVVNLWSYDKNLQNYTFGHAGYYSPESYVSLSVPLEVQGSWQGWSYRARASLTYSDSEIEPAPFYPTDPELQAAAVNSPLPSGFDAPIHDDEGGSGISLSGYAAVEREVIPGWVFGAKLDIDRADYYEPTIFMLYLRHAFAGGGMPIEIPPRPIVPYNR